MNDAPPPKTLYRSTSNKVIAGVAGGLAEYTNLDPTLMRVLFVLLFFASAGFAAILYIILAIIMPARPGGGSKKTFEEQVEEGAENIQQRTQHVAEDIKLSTQKYNTDARLVIALILIVIGFIALSNQFMPMFGIHWGQIWPVLLIVFGLILILKRR